MLDKDLMCGGAFFIKFSETFVRKRVDLEQIFCYTVFTNKRTYVYKGQESEGCHMRTQKRKKYRIKSHFRFITSIVIILGLIISGIYALSGLNKSTALTKTEYAQIEIGYGDTLWEIANEYKSNETDTRKAVYEICKVNNIEASDLTPGTVISVPMDL